MAHFALTFIASKCDSIRSQFIIFVELERTKTRSSVCLMPTAHAVTTLALPEINGHPIKPAETYPLQCVHRVQYNKSRKNQQNCTDCGFFPNAPNTLCWVCLFFLFVLRNKNHKIREYFNKSWAPKMQAIVRCAVNMKKRLDAKQRQNDYIFVWMRLHVCRVKIARNCKPRHICIKIPFAEQATHSHIDFTCCNPIFSACRVRAQQELSIIANLYAHEFNWERQLHNAIKESPEQCSNRQRKIISMFRNSERKRSDTNYYAVYLRNRTLPFVPLLLSQGHWI